jgi:hypothetical protein
MTVEQILVNVARASDAGTPKLAMFQPCVTGATRRKDGNTVITLKLVTNEFTVEDVINGVTGFLALGTNAALLALSNPKAQP